MKLSEFIREIILSKKFSKPRPLEPFFIPLCFLSTFLALEHFKIFFGVTDDRQDAGVVNMLYLKISQAFSQVFSPSAKSIPIVVGGIEPIVHFRGYYHFKDYIGLREYRCRES